MATVPLDGKVSVADATVTSAAKNGMSAVSMNFSNGMKGPIDIVSVTAPLAKIGMLHYDQNMCQGNSTMVRIPNVVDPSGNLLAFSTRGFGAMLMGLHRGITSHQKLELDVTWADPTGRRHLSIVDAVVVPPPAHIHFGSSGSMNMNMGT